MTGSYESGVCTVCDKDVQVRKDGKVKAHPTERDWDTGYCKGSGKLPIDRKDDMDLLEAKALLNSCVREETRSDSGVKLVWRDTDGIQVAGGFSSIANSMVSIWFTPRRGADMPFFIGSKAKELRRCGISQQINNYAAMMEGPRTKISLFNPTHWMTQIGWLGQTGAFYAWPSIPSKEQEPGSYCPLYMEDGD